MANLFRIGGNAEARPLPILMLAICFAAMGGASAQTKPAPQEPAQKSVSPKTVEPKPNEPPGVLLQLNGALESLAAKVSPAVVQILVTGYGPLREEDRSQTPFIVRQHAVGSGVIVDSKGYIMTNAHVVEGAQRIRVALPLPMGDSAGQVPVGKRRILEARLLGQHKETDLALLKKTKQIFRLCHLSASSNLMWANSCSPSAVLKACRIRSPWE
jgi:S1-C subfamily serine protease